MNNKSTNLIFYIGTALLFISIIWFFILYGFANSGTTQKPSISESIQNNTHGAIVDYNYEVKIPSISFHKIKNQTVHATIDVGGIVTAIIGGIISMVLSKLLNLYWPDKKHRT